jgi:branched-chain amino acid transport system permease protein
VFVPAQALWIVGFLLCASAGLWFLFTRTRIGKAMRAASENRRAASLCGINPHLMSALSFAIAAGLGALAGASVAPIASAFYENGLFFGLKGFAAAILGGLGNPLGAIIGGLIIGVTENVAAGYVSSAFKDAIALVILIVLLLVRPAGLIGRLEVKRV